MAIMRVETANAADPLICAKCGHEIDVRPGESYIGSTDGRMWHYGCNPPKSEADHRIDHLLAEIARRETVMRRVSRELKDHADNISPTRQVYPADAMLREASRIDRALQPSETPKEDGK